MTPMRYIVELEGVTEAHSDAKHVARTLLQELSDNLPDPEIEIYSNNDVLVRFEVEDDVFIFIATMVGFVRFTNGDSFYLKDGIPPQFFENSKRAYLI